MSITSTASLSTVSMCTNDHVSWVAGIPANEPNTAKFYLKEKCKKIVLKPMKRMLREILLDKNNFKCS